MNRVSPEVAKEILMLFEDRHPYSLSCEQVAEHHACGTTTHNATRSLKCACHSRCLRNTHCIGQNNLNCPPAGILQHRGCETTALTSAEFENISGFVRLSVTLSGYVTGQLSKKRRTVEIDQERCLWQECSHIGYRFAQMRAQARSITL